MPNQKRKENDKNNKKRLKGIGKHKLAFFILKSTH